ncbi:MAG: SAM-dependent chlorinase/fluorinase [Deltaproteobacteria bacterium]|nr:SAM-dependent chlorinase/fluorinase [Deltaproteobacteria bacterium]
MRVISLLTDFGNADEYVGVMKGVILSITPDVRLVDLCHELPPGAVAAAGAMLEASWRFFPQGTVHLCVVDPGVGTERRVLACSGQGHFFVAPDNGLLGHLVRAGVITDAASVEDPGFFLEQVSDTFHGRDVFAPVAARLASGLSPSELGTPLYPGDLVFLDRPGPVRGEPHALAGQVIWVDRFGNLITDIRAEELGRLTGAPGFGNVRVEAAGRPLGTLRRTYSDVKPGELLALVGSRGLLEIACNMGSAQKVLKAKIGTKVVAFTGGEEKGEAL